MVCLLLSLAAALAACTPSPEDTPMHSPSPDPGTAAQGSTEIADPASGAPTPAGRAAQGPMPEPVSVAENPLPAQPADSPEEARGRRTLSTAFVRLGPDGRLVVERRDGRMLVLRQVIMGPKDYCGLLVSGGKAGGRYCGGYGEVAAARPGAAEPGAAVPEMAQPPRD